MVNNEFEKISREIGKAIASICTLAMLFCFLACQVMIGNWVFENMNTGAMVSYVVMLTGIYLCTMGAIIRKL